MLMLLGVAAIAGSFFIFDDVLSEPEEQEGPMAENESDDVINDYLISDFLDLEETPNTSDEVSDVVEIGDGAVSSGDDEEIEFIAPDSAVDVDGEDTEVISGVSVHTDVASGSASLHSTEKDDLMGTEENDQILLGRGDIATGGDGSDEFIVDGFFEDSEVEDEDGNYLDLPRITDFNPSEDIIKISLPATEAQIEQTYPDRPEFDKEVTYDYVGGDTIVSLDGQDVLIIEGIFELNEENFAILYDYFGGMPTDFDLTYGY